MRRIGWRYCDLLQMDDEACVGLCAGIGLSVLACADPALLSFVCIVADELLRAHGSHGVYDITGEDVDGFSCFAARLAQVFVCVRCPL